MFTPMLQRTLEHVPGAVGAIFADWDGEAVDLVPRGSDELLLLGAHYGVILNHVQSALLTFHFGGAEEIVVSHERLKILVCAVGAGYYVVVALGQDGHLGLALREIRRLAAELRQEIA
jgi:predicted regulator of Ras-like GTPase activity (Roadblock/LC7/MglB family)